MALDGQTDGRRREEDGAAKTAAPAPVCPPPLSNGHGVVEPRLGQPGSIQCVEISWSSLTGQGPLKSCNPTVVVFPSIC